MLELRPAHDPREAYGFVGVVTSLKDLSPSVWVWHREWTNGASRWAIRAPGRLRRLLAPFETRDSDS